MESTSTEGNKALRVVGIVLAILLAMGLICCGGTYLIGGSMVDELKAGFGPMREGSGVLAEQKRLVSGFTGVRLDAVADVIVRQGDAFDVTIRADDNLLPLISTEVVEGVLVISLRENVNANAGIEIVIVAPEIDLLENAGVGDIEAAELDLDRLRVVVGGVGSVEASGTVETLTVEVTGVGDALLGQLVAQSVTATVTGVGDAEIHAVKSLTATVTGVGDIHYRGDPVNPVLREEGVGDIVPIR